jgi:hypothetical protein
MCLVENEGFLILQLDYIGSFFHFEKSGNIYLAYGTIKEKENRNSKRLL